MNDQAVVFLRSLAACMAAKDLNDCVDLCHQHVSGCGAETTVLATCALKVFEDVTEHLRLFTSEIEKPFGFRTSSERDRIMETVLDPFVNRAQDENNIDNTDKRLGFMARVICAWMSFPRTTGVDVLRSVQK